MKKEDLLFRAKKFEEAAKRKPPMMGYTRAGQGKTAEISSAIIRAICELDGVTKSQAVEALKMAEDIIAAASNHDVIS